MQRPLILLALLALAGCESPQQACLSAATRDLNTVNALIAETRIDIERGYGTVTRQEVTSFRRLCPDFDSDGSVGFGWCDQVFVQTIVEPVAIDLRQSRDLLAQLEDQRDLLIPRTNAAVAQCQASFPG
jgi:hypothetical protein